jgi:excisionase family DNA binding protein
VNSQHLTLEDIVNAFARIEALEREVAALKAERDPEGLINAEEAGAMVQMSKDAVLQAARRGTLPAVYNGRKVRFKRSDVVKAFSRRG